MSETLSSSIFTIEADRKPLLAFAAKKYQEAEAFCADERVRTKLKSVRSGGVPVCDDHSILRSGWQDRTKERDTTSKRPPRPTLESLATVFLVDVDVDGA